MLWKPDPNCTVPDSVVGFLLSAAAFFCMIRQGCMPGLSAHFSAPTRTSAAPASLAFNHLIDVCLEARLWQFRGKIQIDQCECGA